MAVVKLQKHRKTEESHAVNEQSMIPDGERTLDDGDVPVSRFSHVFSGLSRPRENNRWIRQHGWRMRQKIKLSSLPESLLMIESETTVDVVSWLASQSTSRSRLSFSVSLIFPFLTTSATSGRSYHYFSWSTVIFTCGMNWNDFVSISCALSSLLLIWQQESSRQQTTNLKAEMINANHEAGGRSYNTHFVWQLSFCVAFNAAAIIVIIITENECSIQ